jgi:hypothetical protein
MVIEKMTGSYSEKDADYGNGIGSKAYGLTHQCKSIAERTIKYNVEEFLGIF